MNQVKKDVFSVFFTELSIGIGMPGDEPAKADRRRVGLWNAEKELMWEGFWRKD